MQAPESSLVASRTIDIEANTDRVWDVLTLTDFIRRWDDVPAGFEESRLRHGSVLEWPGSARVTVTRFEPGVALTQALIVAAWPEQPEVEVGYRYALQGHDGHCRLTITVGDFAHVAHFADAQQLYDASREFVDTAVPEIKRLAEGAVEGSTTG